MAALMKPKIVLDHKVTATFYRTVTASRQWKLWEAQQANWFAQKKFKKCFDMAECMECGWISQKHFQDFLKFVRNLKP